MSIIFFCSHCGARFEVGEQAAGKPGRCKRCGERITVSAQSAAAPTAAAASVAGGPGWLERMGSQVGLAPLTIERMPGLRKPVPKPTPLDDLGDSKPYGLVESYKTRSLNRGGDLERPARSRSPGGGAWARSRNSSVG